MGVLRDTLHPFAAGVKMRGASRISCLAQMEFLVYTFCAKQGVPT